MFPSPFASHTLDAAPGKSHSKTDTDGFVVSQSPPSPDYKKETTSPQLIAEGC
jgi:hypothetical protein